MLRDGKFIKEEPPKIGCNYIPKVRREYTHEEQVMQEINLGYESKMDHKEKDFEFWIILIVCWVLAMIIIR